MKNYLPRLSDVKPWSTLGVLVLGFYVNAFGKGVQPVYEDPFDEAAGGASLTRASQDAVMFANPAVMPFGKKFLRWVGSQFSILAGKDSVDMAQSLSTGSSSSDSEDSSDQEKREEFFDRVFDSPVHFGASSVISFISNNFGFGLFSHFEPDISGRRHGDTGMPEFRARANLYAGGISSFAVTLGKLLSVGVTGKYLYKSEPDFTLSLSDQDQIDSLRKDPQSLRNANEQGIGMGADAGALVFLQGNTIDFRFAFKVDDVGDTQFTKEQEPFLQTFHTGFGMTFHNSIDSLHLSLDFRDITGAYTESIPLRVFTGAKLIIRNFLGVAAGLYQGYPTYGVRLDMIFVTLGLTYFQKEMGDYAQEDGREIYVLSIGLGI